MASSIKIQKENKMGTMEINPLLISMAVPMMLSMLVQALYNVVDSIFVAQLGEDALTAVSLAFPIQNLMIAISVGTGVGVNSLLSRSLGEKNYDRANKAAKNGIFLAAISSLLFVLFGMFFTEFFFKTQTQEGLIINYGVDYLTICTIASTGIFGSIIFERLLQSTGKTVYTMVTQGVGAIINIILDPIMIFGLFGFPAMGVKGAALATVIGQFGGMFLGIYFNVKKNHEININMKRFKPDFKIIKRIYSVGIPSIMMASIGSIMTYGMNSILMTFSSTAAAVFGVYFKLQSFIFMPVFGLNNGMVPIIAYNLGARKKDRIIQTIKLAIIYATIIMLLGFGAFQLIPDKLLLMFNASPEMLSIGTHALQKISISFIFAGFAIVASSVFQALGNGLLSLFVSVGRQLIVLLPIAYLLARLGDVNLVWWAFPIAEIVSMILCSLFLVHTFKKVILKL
ncbi:MATE family efflux transporter [Alloiococcus sp. CFN-8]|uniref:MATE family efflux transporter n=1 Tax=Alloiococcus sp. CFN-8 TaxID=3416081 RepID=UPI003CF57748